MDHNYTGHNYMDHNYTGAGRLRAREQRQAACLEVRTACGRTHTSARARTHAHTHAHTVRFGIMQCQPDALNQSLHCQCEDMPTVLYRIVMAYIVMAYIIMAYIVMACEYMPTAPYTCLHTHL